MSGHVVGPPVPTAEQVSSFRENGFVTLPGLLPRHEVAELADAFDEAHAQSAERSWAVGGGAGDSLITIVSPEAAVPSLRSSNLAREARRVFALFFGVPEHRLLCGWRCFLKPAGGDITPWHQDAAYRPPPHHGGTVWVPLDPATDRSGCLEYIPRSHRQPVREHSLHGHHLVAEPGDDDEGIACPLAPGDISVHSCLTVHRALRNRTPTARRAFAVVCQVADTSDG